MLIIAGAESKKISITSISTQYTLAKDRNYHGILVGGILSVVVYAQTLSSLLMLAL